jgi:uridylate kinase
MAVTHKRILLKISGEVLMGNQPFGIDLEQSSASPMR